MTNSMDVDPYQMAEFSDMNDKNILQLATHMEETMLGHLLGAASESENLCGTMDIQLAQRDILRLYRQGK